MILSNDQAIFRQSPIKHVELMFEKCDIHLHIFLLLR